MQRMGMCIRLKPETVAEYLRLHQAVWPEVLATISACHIRPSLRNWPVASSKSSRSKQLIA